MSSFHCLFLFGNILLILIPLTNAVFLDISCANNTQCGGIGAICKGGKCQCDTPWYTPCDTSQCNPELAFVYEGEECQNDVNCLKNAVCDNTQKRCRCNAGFTAINGLCYKSLNSSCTNSSECWSHECRDGLCKCAFGFISKGDNNRCQRKLAKIYANWIDANVSNDFCYGSDSNGCLVSSAICQNDSQHSEKFCQCPSTFTANYVKQECEIKIYNQPLSPSPSPLSYEECGKCQDSNAICVPVSNQTTCWCLAGFIRINDKTCEKTGKIFIFPDGNDINQHKYASSNCSMNGNNGSMKENNGLCTCAPGYTFVDKTSPCQPIKPEWQNDNFEYGVCTRINSNGDPVQENGLCPAPLTCEARQDKYVCSCGRDKYLDEKTNSCYYFLERNLAVPITNDCPPNSILIGLKCQCSPNGIYTVSTDNKRCELKLIEFGDSQANPPCNASDPTNDQLCADLYRGNTKFCKQGECRCISNSAYYENNICVTLIHADPGPKGMCPTNAQNINGQCTCNVGYRMKGMNRTCERKVNQLNEVVISTSSDISDARVTIEECKALFPEQPVSASNANDRCVCENGAFFNGAICVFYLDYSSLPRNDDSILKCPQDASPRSSPNSLMCKCNPGYKNKDNRTCEKLTDTVYAHNATNGVNVPGIQLIACQILFGSAAEATQNDGYCRCVDETVAFFDANKCYFLVETPHDQPNTPSDCPPTSESDENICKCPVGYQAILPSKRGCERKKIYSSNLQSIDPITVNTRCSDEDCEGLHGVGAVCRNDTCYCDRSRSFVRNNQCVLFSIYVFPGTHERHLYTCDLQKDCGTDADKNGIECDFIDNNEKNYKVCKCKNDYIFNPADSTCVKGQCYPQCLDTEECQGYQCICKVGYYRNPAGTCVQFEITLKLHDSCNFTDENELRFTNQEFSCSSSCKRIECTDDYRDDGSKCVKNNFDDRCAYNPNFCSRLSSGSTCDLDENKCTCLPDYYRTQDEIICARAVGRSCVDDIDCGTFGQCSNRQCRCQSGRKEQEVLDSLGRKIIRCINGSGVDQIRFNPILLLFFVLARVFFS